MIREHLKYALLTAIALVISNCANDLPKISQLGGFRVLAIKFNNPEVAVGDPDVDVSLLISDIEGLGARAISYEAYGCVDPGVSLGAEPTCDSNPTKVSVASGSIAAGTLLASSNYTGEILNLFVLPVPSAAYVTVNPLTGSNRSSIDLYNGVSYLLDLRLTPSGGDTSRSIKRLIVSNKTPKNANPTLNSISISSQTLSSQIATGSAESFVLSTQAGFISQVENLSVSWFVSSGSVKRAITSEGETNEFTPAQTPPGTETFVAVLRDLRGGLDWRIINR